jgi:hypothetical protein
MGNGSRDRLAEREATGDDPFARAARDAGERAGRPDPELEQTLTLIGPLAARDPEPAGAGSAEQVVTGSFSFDDLLRSARRRGFAAGVAAGVLAGAAVAAAVLAIAGGPETLASVERPSPPAAAARAPSPVAASDPSPETPAGLDLRGARADAPPAARVPPASSPSALSPPASRSPETRAARPRRAAPAAPAAVAKPATPVAPRVPEEPATAGAAPAAAAPAASAAPRAPDTALQPAAVAQPRDVPATPPRRLDEEVAAALRARAETLDGCVAATLADGAAVRPNRVRLFLTLDPGGRVSDARFDDAEVDASPLGSCLAGVAQAMSVPPFDGEPVRLALPLRLGRE